MVILSDINDKKLFVTLLMLVAKVIGIFMKIGVHMKFLMTSSKNVNHYGKIFPHVVPFMSANMYAKFHDHIISC